MPKSHVGGRLAENVRNQLGNSKWAKDILPTNQSIPSSQHIPRTREMMELQNGGIIPSATFHEREKVTSIDIDPDDSKYKEKSALKGGAAKLKECLYVNE